MLVPDADVSPVSEAEVKAPRWFGSLLVIIRYQPMSRISPLYSLQRTPSAPSAWAEMGQKRLLMFIQLLGQHGRAKMAAR